MRNLSFPKFNLTPLYITATISLFSLKGYIISEDSPDKVSVTSSSQAPLSLPYPTLPPTPTQHPVSFDPDPMDVDQGAYQLPEWLISNMRDPNTDKTLREMMPTFGYVFKNPEKPAGMPVGIVTVNSNQFLLGNVSYTSMNCNVCHAGQLVIDDKPYTILGAPNKIDTIGWAFFVRETIGEYLQDPRRIISLYLEAKRQKQLPPEIQKVALSNQEETALNYIANMPQINNQPQTWNVSHSTEPTPNQRSLYQSFKQFNASLREVDPSQILKNKAHFSLYLKQLVDEPASQENTQHPGTITHPESTHPADPNAPSKDLAIESYNKHIPAFLALLMHYQKFQDKILPIVGNNPKPGPGRDDAWSILATYIGEVPLDELPAPSLTKIPPLFPYAHYSQQKNRNGRPKPLYQFHADGNTTSFMERNLLQAMAIGAYRKKGFTFADLEAIHNAELESRKLDIPNFQKLGLPHDKELAAKGEKLFRSKVHDYLGTKQSCATCHSHIQGQAHDLNAVGTHQDRYLFFNSEKAIKNKVLERIQTNIRKIKNNTINERPDYHENKSNYEPKEATWTLGKGGYIARPLYGVWSSAPYLHNGSVRTIRELLTAPHLRETFFYTGTRNYNTRDLGYENEKQYTPTPGITKDGFKLVTRKPADKIPANAGHDYGTSWTDEEKDAVIEYLKTMTPPAQN